MRGYVDAGSGRRPREPSTPQSLAPQGRSRLTSGYGVVSVSDHAGRPMNSNHHAKLVPFWLIRFTAAVALTAALALGATAARAGAQAPPGSTPAADGSVTTPATAKPALRSMAIDEALALTKKSPKDTNAWLALGSAYRAAHQYDHAVTAFKKMAAVDPNNSTAWVSLGAVYMDQRKTTDAKSAFQKALKIHPDDP